MSDYNTHAFNVWDVKKETQVVKWRDNNGRQQRKEYRDWFEARKAVKWLVDSGANEVDLAVPANYMYGNMKNE